MKYEIRLATIEKKVRNGFVLPATFDAFVAHCRERKRGELGWFAIKYTDPSELMGWDARESMLPVLRLPDGGFVAFWFGAERSPAIIHCSSDGDSHLVAASWVDFLTRLSKGKTSVPDLDDRDADDFPKVRGMRRSLASLTRLRKQFKAWLAENQSHSELPDSDEGEAIRSELVKLMKKDFERGRREFEKLLGYEVDDDHEERVTIVVHHTSRSYSVSQASGLAYPNAQRLRPALDRLVEYLGRPLKKSDITLWSGGAVFVEGNLCLGDPKFYE